MLQGRQKYVDLMSLGTNVHGPKHVGRYVTRTKGAGTEHQGTPYISLRWVLFQRSVF
jgi:hypothetical protein